MARTFTYLELYNRLEELTDTQNDAHLGAAEKRAILNSAIAETWDLICSSGLGEKYVKSVAFNTVAGQLEYPLGTVVSAGDFYRVSQLYVVEGERLKPLQRTQPAELQAFKAPPSIVPMKLYYIPCAPEPSPTDQATWEASSFDGINGWEEHTLMTAALAVKFKKDDDSRQFRERKRELEGRISTMGNVDHGEPARVVRKRGSRRLDPWYCHISNVHSYGIRGDKLELYYYEGIYI